MKELDKFNELENELKELASSLNVTSEFLRENATDYVKCIKNEIARLLKGQIFWLKKAKIAEIRDSSIISLSEYKEFVELYPKKGELECQIKLF